MVLQCDSIDKGTEELACIAERTMEWGATNRVEFEVSKTEVLAFSKKRKVLQSRKRRWFMSGNTAAQSSKEPPSSVYKHQ